VAIDARNAHLPRISNGVVELAVDPAIGRITHFGRIGGPNCLWLNPHAKGCASPFSGWINYGGDKVWLWPERDWKAWHGVHAPPGDPPAESNRVDSLSSRALRMVSPDIETCGLRIVREISLEPHGTSVTILNRLEKIASTNLRRAIGLWTVTQLPAPTEIFARFVPDASEPKFSSFENGTWPSIRAEESIAILERPRDVWAKIGVDADTLAASIGSDLFSIRSGVAIPAKDYEPHCRAQVFTDPDRSQFRVEGTAPYIECEFTSPTRALAMGESVELCQRWTLDPISATPLAAFRTLIRSH
jgi:hypothetical protein